MFLITDNPLFENFVTPQLCLDLKSAGLTDRTNFQWIVSGSNIKLDTQLFDVDGYYKEAGAYLLSLNALVILPAYTIKDVEKCLPPLLLTKDINGYEASLDKLFQIESKKAPRLPDAFGALLLEAIQKHVVGISRINFLIEKQLTQKG